MNIFVINSGSSSIKYQLFRMPQQKPVCSGLVERIGLENAQVTHKIFQGAEEEEEEEVRRTLEIRDHQAGLELVSQLLTDKTFGVIQDPAEIDAVGHRVVHGGERFAETTVIDQVVKDKIRELFSLAPLHNPSNYQGIEVAEQIFGQARQVAVFDTAFHQSMPPAAYRFAIPASLYQEQGIRAYGFHGTSHKYVSEQACQHLDNRNARLITVHLGNGCSMAAIKEGKSVDTSMGFGPLSGLIMGTRSGDIDPSILFHLIEQEGYTPQQVSTLLNRQSGMKGLTGHSDMRDITKALEEGSKEARLAYELYAYRIKKYIGAYCAVLNGLDALIFTAGVGENDATVRRLACQELDYLGIRLDEEKNKQRGSGIREIQHSQSQVKILIIPTNEELEIAKQCYALLS